MFDFIDRWIDKIDGSDALEDPKKSIDLIISKILVCISEKPDKCRMLVTGPVPNDSLKAVTDALSAAIDGLSDNNLASGIEFACLESVSSDPATILSTSSFDYIILVARRMKTPMCKIETELSYLNGVNPKILGAILI